MSKKGFELQFTWLFVLIAGGILLSFFFLVVRNQIASSKVSDATDFQQELDFILRASQGSRSTEKSIPFGGNVFFTCDEGASNYYFAGSNVMFQYNYLAIFSPRVLDEKSILVKTEKFKAPFSVMPFIYLSGKQVQYVLVGSSPEINRLYSAFPSNFSKKRIDVNDVNSLPDDGFNSVIIIMDKDDFSSPMLSNFVGSRKSVVSFVVFKPNSGISGSFGNVSFYSFDEDPKLIKNGEVEYLAFEHLLGAAFSGDFNIYSCQFEKSMNRLSVVSDIHVKRLNSLSSAMSSGFGSNCNAYYGPMIITLENLKKGSDMANLDILLLQQSKQSIAALNEDVLDETICPPVY